MEEQVLNSFWSKLKKPFWTLAPMEDVTDVVFRSMVASWARPDVFFTEFTSAEGVAHHGRAARRRLRFEPAQRPVVAQIWGNHARFYQPAVREIAKLRFDGVDINMGCPQKKIVKKGHCGGLIRLPQLALDLIHEAQSAATLPVSVKTRIGYDLIPSLCVLDEWIGRLLECKVAVLTVHCRTVQELSEVPAHWDLMARICELRNQISPHTLIIGNGDIVDRAQGLALAKISGVDGLMIGRGIFHNPFLFKESMVSGPQHFGEVSDADRVAMASSHVERFAATWGTDRNFEAIKKFLRIYLCGSDYLDQLRAKAMMVHSYQEVRELLSPDHRRTRQ